MGWPAVLVRLLLVAVVVVAVEEDDDDDDADVEDLSLPNPPVLVSLRGSSGH